MKVIATNANKPVDVDLEQRILRQAVFATTGLASDGWIILPSGIAVERFQGNPVVTDIHIATGGNPQVIARVSEMFSDELEMVAQLQFADTKIGREYAYLYGVNAEKTPYMRAWSVEGPVLEAAQTSWTKARTISGPYWNEDMAARISKKVKSCQVALRFELSSVAAVALGADRGALTRAHGSGVEVAGIVLARIDLEEATGEVVKLKETVGELDGRIARLEEDIQALRSEGASAAARGDSEAILVEARELAALLGR